MSEVHHWPKCAVCSERWGEPTAVEEYEIPPGDVKHASGDPDRITSFQVIGRCSHGKGFRKGSVREQRARVECPEWWGSAHMDDAIRWLIFFAPGVSPEHRLVTSIANG